MLPVVAANLTATSVMSSAIDFFHAGQENATPPQFGDFLLLLATWASTGIALIIASIFARGGNKILVRTGLFICIIVLPFQCGYHAYPNGRYETGFLEWASKHVDPHKIDAWCNSLTPAKKEIEIPQSSWPALIQSLSPTKVYQLPNGNGLVLEWGTLGAWGDSRRVFVGSSSDVKPPTNDNYVLFPWKNIAPGMYAAYQEED